MRVTSVKSGSTFDSQTSEITIADGPREHTIGQLADVIKLSGRRRVSERQGAGVHGVQIGPRTYWVHRSAAPSKRAR